jgi:hypothetical protein
MWHQSQSTASTANTSARIIGSFTPKHLEQCLVNHREKKTLLLAIQDEIITSWEPEWNHHTDTPDNTLKTAQDLVDTLQTRKIHNKMQIKIGRAWHGQIWPSDLDKLAVLYTTHRTENGLSIDPNT